MADLQLVFRAPGHGGVLRDLVSRALPRADSHEIARAFASGGVRVAGARVREPGQRVAGGARIDLRASEGTRAARRAAVALLQRGADFCVVAKPAGWSSGPASRGRGSARELVATAIGLPPAAIRPVHELAEDVAGAW
ncbi:MAG TPA: hypothetical protein VEC18_03600, partial [Myxococcota bacterium]|nr:hypothetical protein [Myxococcota bacterium]